MPSEIVPGIVADAKIAFGKPIIAGTRIPAARVLALMAAGRPESEICTEYELRREDILAVLRFASWLADQHMRAT